MPGARDGGREALVQAYGAREVATGAAILMSHDPTPWIWGRVAGDALDLATLATGFEGDNPRAGTLALATAAVAGCDARRHRLRPGVTADKRLPPPGTYEYHHRSGFPAASPPPVAPPAISRCRGTSAFPTPCALAQRPPAG